MDCCWPFEATSVSVSLKPPHHHHHNDHYVIVYDEDGDLDDSIIIRCPWKPFRWASVSCFQAVSTNSFKSFTSLTSASSG